MSAGSPFELTGKTSIVTGAGSGIGRATAQVLAAAGSNVVAADVVPEGLEETARAITGAGGKAIAVRTDVTSKAEVDGLVDQAVAEFGRLDVMCNVAGIALDSPIEDLTEQGLDRVVAVNLKGVLFGCQAAVRAMKPQGSGSIINVSSSVVDAPAPTYGAYAMTKAAVVQLTRTLAVEAGRFGIRVNAVAPGMTITGFTMRHVYRPDGTMDAEKYEAFVERMAKLSPLRRVGEPEDQAHLMLFLASDAARWCTGQVWRANGGQTFGP